MGLFSSRYDPEKDLPDLTGRVAIVTGGNIGIGLYTVLHLANKRAKVYLGARSESKFKAGLARLKEEKALKPNAGEIVWLNLSLTEPRDAKKAAEWFLTQEKRLDILVNNAGKIISPYGLTPDGLSDSVVINHLSPFLFTSTLIPLMKETTKLPGADVRIVMLSSLSHRWVKNPRYDSLKALNNDFSDTSNPKSNLYSYTKLANILYASELQRRFDAERVPIITIAVQPGYVLSDGNVRLFSSLYFGKLLVWLAKLWFVTSSVGAYTSAFAAASPQVRANPEKYKGKYVVPYGTVEETSKDAQREDLAKELWKTSEEVLRTVLQK